MDLGLLKVFRAVAEEGSLSKAAQRLNYVQSNVTARMQQLEEELETPLFYRHSRGITLTAAGQTLLAYSEQIFHLCEEAVQAVKEEGHPRGALSLGAVEEMAAVRLPGILSAYQKEYRDVEVQLRVGSTAALIEDVLHYKLDGAFVKGPVRHPDLVQEDSAEDELVLVTAPDHPPVSSLGDLQMQTYIVMFSGCLYRTRLEEWLRQEGQQAFKLMELGTSEGILGCVKAGLGFTLMPRSYVEKRTRADEVALHPIPERYAGLTTLLIRRRDLYLSRAWQAFVETVHHQADEEQAGALA
ncbi:MAG TPA: LysR family transcriptional regulator [Bacilli bacterium]|nr:LysR family transcriptional regulator [Bacilli bacterium]